MRLPFLDTRHSQPEYQIEKSARDSCSRYSLHYAAPFKKVQTCTYKDNTLLFFSQGYGTRDFW